MSEITDGASMLNKKQDARIIDLFFAIFPRLPRSIPNNTLNLAVRFAEGPNRGCSGCSRLGLRALLAWGAWSVVQSSVCLGEAASFIRRGRCSVVGGLVVAIGLGAGSRVESESESESEFADSAGAAALVCGADALLAIDGAEPGRARVMAAGIGGTAVFGDGVPGTWPGSASGFRPRGARPAGIRGF